MAALRALSSYHTAPGTSLAGRSGACGCPTRLLQLETGDGALLESCRRR